MKALRLQKDRIWLFCAIVLFLLGFLVYIIKGFYLLTIDRQGAIDLFFRWQEQQYIYRGFYPYDIQAGSIHVDPQIGPITSGGYPPWAFFTGFFLVPGFSFELTRFYFAVLNAISLIVVAIFAYQIGVPYGRSQALFSMSACLAFGSIRTTLLNGQYGIIINAFLIAMFWSYQKHRYIWSGIWLAIATIKPNISAFYFFILLVRRRTNALLSFFIYIAGASSVIWLITKTDPLYMSNAIINQSKYFAHEGYSSVNFLTNIGIDSRSATILIAAIGAIAVTAIFYFCRDRSLLTLFAIAAIIGRVAVYHRFYDNVMLVFLMLALIEIVFNNPNTVNLLMMVIVGITLWLPGRIVELPNVGPIVESTQIVIWLGALVYLLIHNISPKISKSKDASDRVSVP